MAQTLNNRNFGVALLSGLFSAVAPSLLYGLMIYINTFVWGLPSSSILLLMLTNLVAAPLACFLSPWLCRRMGKRAACAEPSADHRHCRARSHPSPSVTMSLGCQP